MSAPISVVIPTLNAAKALPACAASLIEGVSEGIIRELIVSDGGSTDNTVEIAHEIGAEVVSGPASRGGQLQRGCAVARGSWLLVVHADTQLAQGWSGQAIAHMALDGAGWGRLRFDRGGAFVAAWANLRSRMVQLPYGDQSLLLPSQLYHSVGGYSDQPLMEDVDLALKLRGHLSASGIIAVTSAEKYRKDGWLRRGAMNLSLLARYLMGAKPETLAILYRK